jgi:hypothetical protein
MVKTQFSLLALLSTLVSVSAAPAIVWSKSSAASGPIHSSALLDAASLVNDNSDKKQVVFLLGRDESGNEGLTPLTISNSIPKVAERYAEASAVHHYVRGIESVDSLVAQTNAERRSLLEFNSLPVDEKTSDVTVVNLASASPSEIDAVVSSALNDASVDTVILTSVRGVSEVKLERDVANRKNYHDQMKQSVANAKFKNMQKMMNQQNRRRLEDRGDDNENADGSTDGIYFVNFTPNIFSGLLFFGFFIFITFVGFGCLNMIVGQQDNYVSKYPAIGKEV